MRKYIIEVSEEGIKKTFINAKKRYEETWVRDENGGSRTLEAGITAQLDQYGDFEDEELIELLDEDDIDGLWNYFEETKEIEELPKRGKLIKNLATCSKCKSELLNKYEDGIWGFSVVLRNKNNELYTICPICNNEEKYPIDKEDIKEFIKL
ncbi:hypothetical protein CF088_19035 [Clostridium botulinum]|uniref:Uncharacterized protein n=2 Tax=Clostridium botulinum TaxID=1491 RepID=A0A0D1BNQ0_CLOBO|nr:hypothetical protein [Clostridium botulinum]APH24227.1 hypothetical protein NPD1_3090 [Clostridium botulinum]APQ68008.1 hypothetical protein RSJ8_1216 [Clostridium botulinum]APR02673.1 hypothetical protein RSJ2_3784 [Clostridium botulinum]AUN19811.1 hypothetical protein B2M06_19895 [Clostridium botulinum]EPS54235.1 hypothetical protein CLQ_13123 [Clostridium botulinum Af84]